MRLLALLLLSAVATDLSAQRPRAAVGAQVGYSRSDIGGSDAQQVESRQGALSGVYLHFPFTRAVAVRPELLFALKGGRTIAQIEGGGTATLDIELAYLELPVLAHLTVPAGRWRPVFFAGPAPALQIGCDLEVIVEPAPIRVTCDAADITFRGWDFGVVGGAGVETVLNRVGLALEARYTYGLRSIVEDLRFDNRTFALLVALTF